MPRTGAVPSDPTPDSAPPAVDSLLSWRELHELEPSRIYDLHRDHVNSVFVRLMRCMSLDKTLVRAEGAYVWDPEGRRYLDFFGGFGCMNLGHNHPHVVARLRELLSEQRPMIFQTVAHRYTAALAKNLAVIAPGEVEVSFFCSTGTEAAEGALKLVRKATGREKIVHTLDAYHGRTLGALSVNGFAKLRTPFAPLLPQCQAVPWGDLDALEQQLVGEDVAAFIVEPILGYAGVILPPPGYLKECERLCHRHGTLLIADEVQTGFGRTGKMFACEHENVEPDVVMVGKSLGGGLVPIGAYMTTRQVWTRAYGTTDDFILHTNTFGGNSFASAAALATIETITRDRLLDRAVELGRYLTGKLEELRQRRAFVQEIRGLGLMIAVELDPQVEGYQLGTDDAILGFIGQRILGSAFLSQLVNEHGVFVGSSQIDRHWLRVYPPLTVTREQIDLFVEAFDRVCADPDRFRAGLREIAQHIYAEFVGKDT